MRRVAEFLTRLHGWRRYAAAGAAGAASMLAFAPLHAWPVLFVTFPALVWVLDGIFASGGGTAPPLSQHIKAAFWTGWWFGFGYFLCGLYWIGFAFLVEAEIFAVLLPFAVTLMPAGLALFFAAACAVAAAAWRPGLARILGLAVTLTAAEWLRGKVLTGFPWNTLGYALTGPQSLMQTASVFGVYTLTLFAVLLFAMPALVCAAPEMAEQRAVLRRAPPVVMLALLAAGFVWGHLRLERAETRYVDGVRLRIVQPNIPQKEKWKPENRAAIFQRYLTVSRDKTLLGDIGAVTHLIWPESAVPFLLADTPEALDAIAELVPRGATFITGAARGVKDDAASSGLRVYNSLYVMSNEAKVLSVYDKTHLVPFGEYLPFQDTLESIGLSQLTRIRGGFARGEGGRAMSAPGVPDFIALICYEIIFPDSIREKGASPGWLLNVTNDAWFGDSAGPYQHFHQARVRAVEQGLPVVRAANTGISAVIDAYGRIVARIPRNTPRAMDSPLPAALPHTVFSRRGRAILAAALALCAFAWVVAFAGAGAGRR